jgi:hypothetical protein
VTTSDNTPTPSPGTGSPSNTEAQHSGATPPQGAPDRGAEQGPPYNLWFALSAIGVGLVAYVVTILVFGAKFDSAAVTAALGALFTLIGTVSGAYFGIKSSSDTADKADRTTKEAQEKASNAAGALDSGEWERLKGKGLL